MLKEHLHGCNALVEKESTSFLTYLSIVDYLYANFLRMSFFFFSIQLYLENVIKCYRRNFAITIKIKLNLI